MALVDRETITVFQGVEQGITITCAGTDLTGFDFRAQCRADYASDAEQAATEPLFSLAVGTGLELGTPDGDDEIHTVIATLTDVRSSLLTNQSNIEEPLYLFDVQYKAPGGVWLPFAYLFFAVQPQVIPREAD
jgi:hypothetical protein